MEERKHTPGAHLESVALDAESPVNSTQHSPLIVNVVNDNPEQDVPNEGVFGAFACANKQICP